MFTCVYISLSTKKIYSINKLFNKFKSIVHNIESSTSTLSTITDGSDHTVYIQKIPYHTLN